MAQQSSVLPELNLLPKLPKDPDAFSIIMIGAGVIVNLAHLPAYKLAGFTIKGIFDVDRQKAVETAKKFDVPRVYETLEEACTSSPNEKVIFDVAVPSNQIIPILQQIPVNSHALLQKPMGEILTEAQAIVDLCKQRNIRASVNFQLRYAPYILAMKDAIRQGWLGDKIVTIEIHVNDLMPWLTWPHLATAPRIETTYHSIHYVDLVRELVAPHDPIALHCRTCRHAAMPELSPVRTVYSFKFAHDPMLFANIYANHHHRWGLKNAQSYVLVEGTGGAAKAQIGDNLLCGRGNDPKLDYLQVKTFYHSV
jgi:predicted dehydrogenase